MDSSRTLANDLTITPCAASDPRARIQRVARSRYRTDPVSITSPASLPASLPVYEPLMLLLRVVGRGRIRIPTSLHYTVPKTIRDASRRSYWAHHPHDIGHKLVGLGRHPLQRVLAGSRGYRVDPPTHRLVLEGLDHPIPYDPSFTRRHSFVSSLCNPTTLTNVALTAAVFYTERIPCHIQRRCHHVAMHLTRVVRGNAVELLDEVVARRIDRPSSRTSAMGGYWRAWGAWPWSSVVACQPSSIGPSTWMLLPDDEMD